MLLQYNCNRYLEVEPCCNTGSGDAVDSLDVCIAFFMTREFPCYDLLGVRSTVRYYRPVN
jgi:hypothetical protein